MATLTTPPLAAGSHSFTAVYSGDDTFDTSTSAAATATIDTTSNIVSLSGASSVNEGTQYNLGLPTTAGGHSVAGWSINWGDGTLQPVSGDPFSESHTYRAGQLYDYRGGGEQQRAAYSAALGGGAVTVSQVAPSDVNCDG